MKTLIIAAAVLLRLNKYKNSIIQVISFSFDCYIEISKKVEIALENGEHMVLP